MHQRQHFCRSPRNPHPRYCAKGPSFPPALPLTVSRTHFGVWKMRRSLLKTLPFLHHHHHHLLLLLPLFLLLQVVAPPTTSFSQPLPSHPLPSQSPTPSPSLHTSPAGNSHHHHLRQVLLGLLLGCTTGFSSSLLFIFLIRHCLFFINQTPVLKGPVVFSQTINPRALHSAISSNSQATNLLGSGPHGKYLRATLDDGLLVAIKLVEPNCSSGSPMPLQGQSAKRKVQQGLEVLALVKHRNVMSLRAYVCEQARLSLVYDYVGNGSLEDVMKTARSSQVRLGWDVRHKIAVGIARGLRYLHFECNPRILHHDLKPSNVLLDEELEPRLADCGLARLLGGGGGDGDVVGVELVSNYMAPECLQSCRYTDKSDVYSFGVILGMLLTGKDPSDPFFSGEHGSLGWWLRNLQQRGEAHEALDKAILGEECEEDEMMMAIRIVVVCLSDLPADRPSSDELVAMLTQLHSF